MTIIDEIKRITDDILGLPFIYASLTNINSLLDVTELPCVACQRFANGTMINDSGLSKQQADFLIFFLDITEFDFDSLENQDIIDEMTEHATAFVREVEKSNKIQKIGETRFDVIYDTFDVNVTGIVLRMTLKDFGVAPCFPQTFNSPFENEFN